LVESIRSLKDELLMQAEQDIHDNGGVDHMMIDDIKDLAEAEKACWEASYYRAVTEAMEDGQMGYDGGMGRQGRGYRRGNGQDGQGNQGRGYRRGYRGRDSMGRYTSRKGYGNQDMMQEVRQMMETADPQEREQMRMKLREIASM
jgi:hypothetical protein